MQWNEISAVLHIPVNCMPPKKAMFCWPGYTIFEMGIKLTVIEPLIRIKKKILKFLPGKNLLQEKRPKMAFLSIFGAFLVLLHEKCSSKSHETLHLRSSWFNPYIHERKKLGSYPLGTQNGPNFKILSNTWSHWHIWVSHFSKERLQTSWGDSQEHKSNL